MLRTTLYGTLTHDEELNKNEKAMLYIKECAELVGLEVIEGETAFSITFMAEIMKRLKETIDNEHQWIPVSERLPEEFADVICCTDAKEVFIASYLGKLDDGTECFDDDNGMMCEGDVIAWMPLPEPYKEVSKT